MSQPAPVPAAEAPPQMAHTPEHLPDRPLSSVAAEAEAAPAGTAASSEVGPGAIGQAVGPAAVAAVSTGADRSGLRAQAAENPLLTLFGGILAFLGLVSVGLLSFVLVSLAADIDQVNERITRLEARMDARFARVDARFAEVDERFDEVDARFDEVDERFDEVEARIDAIDARLDRIELTLTALIATLGATEAVEAAVAAGAGQTGPVG